MSFVWTGATEAQLRVVFVDVVGAGGGDGEGGVGGERERRRAQSRRVGLRESLCPQF